MLVVSAAHGAYLENRARVKRFSCVLVYAVHEQLLTKSFGLMNVLKLSGC